MSPPSLLNPELDQAQVHLYEAFVALARHSPMRALDALPEVLDSPPFVDACSVAAAGRGLRRDDILPEKASLDLPAEGGWIQVLDVANLNRYGAQIGFEVAAGSVWYAVPDHADATQVAVVAPYASRRTATRDAAHTFSLPLRLVRIETPAGPMMIYPREYERLDVTTFAATADRSAFTALDEDDTGVDADQVFALRSRGITRDVALGMLAFSARTPRLGWFTPKSPSDFDSLALMLSGLRA